MKNKKTIFTITFFQIFKQPLVFFIIILAAFSIGISIQQYWIFENCSENLQKLSNACKDNTLRLWLGGPVAVIPVILLFISFSVFLFRLSSDREITDPRLLMPGIQKKLSRIFLIFLFWQLSVGLNYLKPLLYISLFLLILFLRIAFPEQMKRLWNNCFPPV